MEHKPREITHQMKPNYFQYELVIHTCNFWAHQEQMSTDDGDALIYLKKHGTYKPFS